MEHLQRKSQLKVFFFIYLAISVAVGSSIYLMNRKKKALATAREQKAATEKVVSKTVVSPVKKPKSTTPAPKKPELPKEAPAPVPAPVVAKKAPLEKKKTTNSPLPSAELEEIKKLYPVPKIKPLLEIVQNWQAVPEKAFPKLVAIKKPVSFQVSENGQVVANGKLPIGSMMVPEQLQGDRLFLRTAGSMPIKVTVPVADTDFKELIESRYHRFVQKTNSGILAKRKAEIDRRVGAVVLEKSLSMWNPGKDPRFEPLKTSLKKGEVATYSLFDAEKWRWGGKETIDGTEYSTAFVLIVSEAAFGVSERELKALINADKVEKWIDPATGETL